MAADRGAPLLTDLYYSVTADCNLVCKHCWIRCCRSGPSFSTRAREKDELTAEELENVLEQACALGLESVKFTGGEPLLREDFPEIYDRTAHFRAGSERLALYVETNGTIDFDEVRHVWSRHPPEHVSLSLDSSDPIEHDSFRGADGAFDRTLSFAAGLREQGIGFQVITTLLSCEADWVLPVIRLSERIGASTLKLNPISAMGRGASLLARAGEEERGARAVERLLDLSDWIDKSCSSAVHLAIPRAFRSLQRLPCFGECSVLNNVGLLPDGGYSICGVGLIRPELVFGNCRRDLLADIWTGSALLRRLRRSIPDDLQGICSTCVLRSACMGHCVAENYCETGCFESPQWFCRLAGEAGRFPVGRQLKGFSREG
jgi:SynChlorMet cassette radical SAM/SPASM protein ScmF